MSTGLYTPLQLIAGAGLLANTGIAVASNLSNAVSNYNSVPTIASLLGTLDLAATYGLSGSVITQLQTLGASNCPALGASVPTAYANTVTPVQTAATIPATVDGGFGQLVLDIGNKYLGDGDLSQFVSIYSAATSFQTQTAQIIYSTVNANKLATTFTGMNDLITGDVTKVSLAIPALAEDFSKIGQALSLAKLDTFGTPAGLLQQISIAAGIVRGTLPSIQQALLAQGITPDEIVRLCTPEASNLDLTRSQFNALQSRAYPAMATIVGTDLADILDILDVTIAGVSTLQDLLNPIKLFTTSWPSLMTVTDAGPQLIYQPDGSINPAIQGFVNSVGFGTNNTVTGCDELGKIVPQTQAVASVAVGVSLSQIKNISTLTTSSLAKALA